MIRPIIALICGVAVGVTVGKLFGLANAPFFSVTESEVWLTRILMIALIGFITGGVTSLVAWQHTPGLPGMAYALTLTILGFMAKTTTKKQGEDFWVSTTVEAVLILLSFLLAYAAAWLADTQVVFRSLPVKPTPKQVNSKLLIKQLIPCAVVTMLIGGLLRAIVPLPSYIIVPLAFTIAGFSSSYIFKSRSTLWYSAASPIYLATLGLLIIIFPALIRLAPASDWRFNNALIVCGLAAGSAILGHWLRTKYANQ